MDRRSFGRRTVSLVLALELLLSPVAMARAADPAQIFAVPEIPLGEEVLSQTLPGNDNTQDRTSTQDQPQDQFQAQVMEGDPRSYDRVFISTNLSVTEESVRASGKTSYYFRLNSASRLLNVEVTNEEDPLLDALWMHLQYAQPEEAGSKAGEDSRYTYLRSLLDARVPDMEFDSYCLVTADTSGNVLERIRPLGQDGQETLLDDDPGDIVWPEWYWIPEDGQLVRLQDSYDTVVEDEWNGDFLPIAAWYNPSSKAMLTALDMTVHGSIVENTHLTEVYTQDPLKEENPTTATLTTVALTDLASDDSEGNKDGTEFETREMWIQVGSDQTSLDLRFQTYEPYYSYTQDDGPAEDATCPVSVTYSLDGGANQPLELTLGENGNLTCQFLPRPERNNKNQLRGANSPENKARGDWQVTGVPLTGGDNASPAEVDVNLTVTAPDGKTQTTYTIHVQRRQSVAGKGTSFYGNTPYGMIARDDSDKWTDTLTKDLARERFRANALRFSDSETRPSGAVNQNGGIYHKWAYTPYCWPSVTGTGADNVDLNETAIVAYQDMVFQDPGVTFTDSFGRQVDLEKDLYQGTVTRTIKLQTPQSGVLSADSWTLPDALIKNCWYNDEVDGKLTDNDKAAQVLTSLNQKVDLRGLAVLPGIYEILYSYTDPYTDATTPATGKKPTYTDSITRTLVILPIPGDVDMDGAVTSADAYAMRNHLAEWNESANTNDRVKLAIGRVFDLTGNGTLEEADYQAILKGYQPELIRSGPISDYFYLPLPKGDTGYQRKTWNQVKQIENGGTLTLEFLGVEQGKRSGAYTVDPKGPFDTKKEADGKTLTPVTLKDQETGVDDSVFWMGVKLENSSLNGDSIEDFTLTLTYDSRYVEPAEVYTASDKTSYESQADAGTFEGWSYTLRKYNLRNTDTVGDQVIWKGAFSAYDATGSTKERTYQTHYSKVLGELEQDRGTTPLRELVVSLRYLDNGYARALVGDGYLLVVPFKLKMQPPKELTSNARLIELGAGMRDLTLVTTARDRGFLASLFNVGRAAGTQTTSAFSAQDDIYGGSTQNLRDDLSYDTQSGTVPIGKDNTAREVLPRATYGKAYQKSQVGQGSSVSATDDFPPGLVYNASPHTLAGTPLLPGTYLFEVNEILYELKVEKRTMHYRPRPADSYYGESEYRGSVTDRAQNPDLRNFEFQYNARYLAPADRVYARNVLGLSLIAENDDKEDEWRDGAELMDILNRTVTDPYDQTVKYTYTYTAPGFTATVNTAGDPVAADTPVGEYVIRTTRSPVSTCYAFVEDRTAAFTVVRRPVYVDRIIATAADSGLVIYNDERVAFSSRTLYDKVTGAETTTEIILALPPREADGTYSGRPLTGDAKLEGDRVAVNYDGTFLHDLDKGDTSVSFQLTDRQEERQVEAQRVTLRNQVTATDGTEVLLQSSNYYLADASVHHTTGKDDIKGIVIIRGVSSMELTALPLEFGRVNYYGESIENPGALMVKAVLGEGNSSALMGSYTYNSPDLFPLLIHYNWVTPEEYAAGTAPGEETSLTGTGVDPVTGRDTRPYGYSREEDPENRVNGGYRDNYLYPDMNGWRICACVTQYVGDEEAGAGVQYIKRYSDPISVEAKILTVTAKSVRRFYGEDLREGQMDYTFNTSQLAPKDMNGVSSRGTSEELAMVFARLDAEMGVDREKGDEPVNRTPELEMVDDKGKPVDKYTAAGTYKVSIFGASSPCYDIQYTIQTVDSPTTSTSKNKGSAPLIIQPRPIIVETVRGNGEGGSFTNIYADTKNLVVTKDPVTGALLEAVGTNAEAQIGNAKFILPEYNSNRGTTSYYTVTGGGSMYTDYGCTFPEGTENALVTKADGTVDDVRVKYQARFLPDPGCYTWAEFTQGFFDNDPIAASPTGYQDKQVQVEKMELTGEDSRNYVMVFGDGVSFMDQVPADAMNVRVTAPANNNQAVNKLYYVSGTGRVYLRPIQNIVITSLGQMNYTYGDQFAPDQPGSDGIAMTVQVKYATLYDNDPNNNVNTEEVVYRQLRVDETGQRVSTFAARGFTIYYVKPGQDQSAAETGNQTLTSGDIMIPGDHHGATLFVTGRRSEKDNLVYSHYDGVQAVEEIQVDKATLTLTATDAHKFYGEPNPTGDYSFTFDTRQLVQLDQDALRELKGVTRLDREGTKADLTLLDSAANFNGLTYSTTATATSKVGANGKWGEYDLNMTAADRTKVLTNYNVVTEGASLYVYPRPVGVTAVTSSQGDPVYTIFNNTDSYRYQTQLSTADRVEVACGSRFAIVNAGDSGDGKVHSLPVTPEVGLLNGDNLIFNAQVEFPSDLNLVAGAAEEYMGVRVTINSLVETETTRNYKFESGQRNTFGDIGVTTGTVGTDVVWGSAKLRTIASIAIRTPPAKLEYTYGEPLDLTGLQVQIMYEQQVGEGIFDSTTVSYLGPDQFRSMGLYVNYWTPGEALPTTTAARRALPGNYFPAATGDHVTIAPTHDTQRYLTNPGTTPTTKPFAANGKYLVISAFQEEGTSGQGQQNAAAPVILGARLDTNGQYEGTPTPIKVNPLKLRYTLRAQDKTYDGDTKAAGSLTLTNVYGSGLGADVVYVPLGAGYERTSMNHNDFATDFKQNVVDGRVTFTTGTYTENGEAPLGGNGKVTWADGYTWGKGLTFTFPNPNVHYVDASGVSGVGTQDKATYWRTSQSYDDVTRGWDSYKAVTSMPVEVTNMALAGPDAKNYTWDWNNTWAWDEDASHRVTSTAVLMTTRSTTEDGQAAAPFATIHKANRAPIQDLTGYSGKPAQLMVDRATNVVRLLLAQELSRLGNNNNVAGTTDEFRGELHFEYALLYAQTGEDGQPTGLLAQWAGADGQKDYQDTTFFGGETVTPLATAAGYKPALDRLPKIESKNNNTIYKGQLYQWAELDTGVVTVAGRTFREDSGFVLDPSAYPGGAILTDKNGNAVKAEDAYWYYTLYTTDRANLPRDTVFYPLVRLAETHNYNASGNLSGDEKVTAALLDAAQKALDALAADNTAENLAAARAASQAVLNAAKGMEADAKTVSQAQMDFDRELAETNRWPQEQPASQIGPASAIKTLTQRLDLTSASTERSQDTTDTTNYLVELLEAVWFTDTLFYEEEKYLSAVVYNHPSRYYGYFWDADKTARLEFRESALNFTGEIYVPVRVRQEDGSMVELTIAVNLLDKAVDGRVAKIYVQTTTDTGNRVRNIQILPTVLYARLGDAPYQLSWATDPEKPTNRNFRWTSSDPSVATVDENGLVTFRGLGTCTITLSSDNGKSSTITVTVSEVLPFVEVAQSLFNFQQNEAWMELDEDGNFYPKLPMTRAQVVELLDLFLNPNGQWSATAELAYLDVTGQERYAEALKRMVGAGVVTGLPDSVFGGDRLITRAEFAAMLTRMLRLDAPDTKGQAHQFLDAGEEETWAYRYIDALGKTGVTRGTGGGNFSPSRILTREEAAAMIARLLTVKLDMDRPGLNIPADMTPTNWSYQYVLQAINNIVFPDPVVERPANNG